MIALGGLGLLVPWIREHGWSRLLAPRSLALHGLALVILAGLAGIWMLALRRYGGPELWHEWFWNNHVGRFTGQATQLGHKAWIGYYFTVLPLYLLPWLVAWLIGVGGALRKIWRKETLEMAWHFLLWWGLAGLLLLTISSTKREIYLSVLLPAFALMIVPALRACPVRQLTDREPLFGWVRGSMKIWQGLMLAVLGLLILAPVAGVKLGMPIGELLLSSAMAFVFAGLAVLACLWQGRPLFDRWWLATALAYLSLLSVLAPLVDRVKSYGPAFHSMARQVAAVPDARIAAWTFDETTRAGFYYYCDLVFPPVSDKLELISILKGEHSRFNGILALSRRFPPVQVELPPWRVLGAARMGPRRELQWVGGIPAAGRPLIEER
jgi:hypothetical protein